MPETVKTNYHPVGTCRMGRDGDPDAVVTADLKVRGVEGLRMIDASIMPMIPSGNTNAPVLADRRKAVEIIMRGEGPAPLRRLSAERPQRSRGAGQRIVRKAEPVFPIERCAASGAPSRSPRPSLCRSCNSLATVDKPRCHPILANNSQFHYRPGVRNAPRFRFTPRVSWPAGRSGPHRLRGVRCAGLGAVRGAEHRRDDSHDRRRRSPSRGRARQRDRTDGAGGRPRTFTGKRGPTSSP